MMSKIGSARGNALRDRGPDKVCTKALWAVDSWQGSRSCDFPNYVVGSAGRDADSCSRAMGVHGYRSGLATTHGHASKR
jgi:hypothetical protein